VLGGILFALFPVAAAQPEGYAPLSRTFEFRGAERTYFVALPCDFNPDNTYWPLVVVHGGGGNARANPKAIAMRQFADQLNLPAILILPEFITDDKQLSRFPVLGEDAFLKDVLKNARTEFKLHEKILLTGYSMGGQFSHRFAFANPDLVQACAAFAAGTWTIPDGRLLIETYGEVQDPKDFLSNPENATKIPERLHDLFDARTVDVAGIPAGDGAKSVPFLVMCGTLDTRFSIAQAFAASLRDSGFDVATAWPETPHGSGPEKYATEFEKYPEHAVQFFLKHTGRE
jgi:pimeloyl-ACP methyl ester carboxylesterase